MPKLPTSDIWLHFERISGSNRAECHYCQATLSTAGGSTGNLKRHLKFKHLTEQGKKTSLPPTASTNPTDQEAMITDIEPASVTVEDTGEVASAIHFITDTTSLSVLPEIPVKHRPSSKKQKTITKEVEQLKPTQEAIVLTQQLSSPPDDRHDIFGKFVASEIRQIDDPNLYCKAKWEIQDTLRKYQQHILNGDLVLTITTEEENVPTQEGFGRHVECSRIS